MASLRVRPILMTVSPTVIRSLPERKRSCQPLREGGLLKAIVPRLASQSARECKTLFNVSDWSISASTLCRGVGNLGQHPKSPVDGLL